ncbi:MAG: MMPL family transporter [Actinobacteria bacterium]|nr:MMPL family transporter [Actinomycetota bacterium]
MFESFGRWVFRRRWWVIGLAVAFTVFAATWGIRVFGDLTYGGFADPGAESSRAAEVISTQLGQAEPDVIVLYRSDARTVDDPSFGAAVARTVTALPRENVRSVTTYWPARVPQLVSTDRHATYVVLSVVGADDQAKKDSFLAIKDRLAVPGLRSTIGGSVAIGDEINRQVSSDLTHAEALSMPILLVLLVLIFGSLVAASLPLVVGGLAILGAFTALRGIAQVTDVSVFSINLVTLAGLGLAIDYGLFMVSRFREELGRGRPVPEALGRTVATAGRTVAISAVTVAIAMSGLAMFPQVFLRSMGYGGVAAVLLAMVFALTVLPALLAVLGHRVDALSLQRLVRRRRRTSTGTAAAVAAASAPGDSGAWAWFARAVMRRPVLVVAAVLAVLVTLGLPFLRVSFGGVDSRVLPASSPARQAQEAIARDFPGNVASPIEAVVVLPGPAAGAEGQADLTSYLGRLGAVPGVRSVQLAAVSGDHAKINIGYDGEATSPAVRDLVAKVRAVPAPPGSEVLVGGQSAILADLLRSVGGRLPWMAVLVAVTTFILLFLAFGSVVLPVKAIATNVLSLSATFGALVWIFQDGHLSGPLGFTSVGSIEATQPILMLALAFGLSMDYEVFLLSRVREQYDVSGDNTWAVATGVQRTGRIITSAALLLIVVTAAFATSQVLFVKLIGVGMVIAIAVDATIVRMLLVPATMRLLGRFNWWAPRPLRRLYARFGISETSADPAPAPGSAPSLRGH